MRLVIFGGQGYANQKVFDLTMHILDKRERIDVVIHGAAPGADTMAENWGRANSREILRFPFIRSEGKLGGFKRNQQMVDEGKPDRGLMFPGGNGTADMRQRLENVGINVEHALREIAQDSRGNTLYKQKNGVGGHTYWSDEIGGGTIVWDTSLVSREMIMLALKHEQWNGEK
jgi:hypothetical protein